MFLSVRSFVKSQKHYAEQQGKSLDSQRGNIFFTLFGAVVVVGLLGTVITSTMRGPLTTMVEVQARTQAESEMAIASRLSLLEATELANSGDCDGDNFVEPLEYTPGAGPTGGGFLPNEVASARIDPWGTEYGYCAWDAGSVTNDAACEIDGNAGNQRLLGNGSPTDETYTVVAIVSAGPDQVFETACNGGASPSITKSGDDIVVEYTYATATASTGGLWNLKQSFPGVAEITKDIEVTGQASFSDGINLTGSPTAALRLGAASMLLPDETTLTTCNGANDGLVRINTTTNPNTMELCDSGTGWVTAAGVWTAGAGNDIFYNSTTPQVGIGTATPNSTLDVVGTFDLSGAATLGGSLSVASSTELQSDLSVNKTAKFGDEIYVAGAATLDSTLAVQDAVKFSSSFYVDGATELNSTLAVSDAAKFGSSVNINGTLFVNDATELAATLSVNKSAKFGEDLFVGGNSTFTKSIDAQDTISNSTGNVAISDDVDISSNLDVAGNIDGTDITASSDLAAGSTISVNGDQLGPALNCSSSQKLEWNNGSGWSCVTDLQGGSGGGVPALDDITDVSAATPSDGDCLTYNNTSGDWENGSCTGTTAGIFEVVSNVIRVKSTAGDYTNDDFVFGSPQLDDDSDANHDNRLFFDKSKGAFRVGRVDGAQWNSANVGDWSFAAGNNVTAFGESSIAMGAGSSTGNDNATAIGTGASVTGPNSIAFGPSVTSGSLSTSFGLGFASTVDPVVSGDRSFGIFMGDQSNVDVSADNTFSLMGGTMAVGDVAATTGGEQDLEFDVTGDIGAANYCDEDGNDCFTASAVSGGIWTDLGGDRIHYGATGTEQVGIGTSNPQVTLDVNGSVRVGSVTGAAAPRFMNLNDLGDVSASAPTTGDCITYNNVTGEWEAGTCVVSGDSITLPINADNALSPAGQIISINAGADNFLSFAGTDNIFLGRQAGNEITTGDQNSFVGVFSGDAVEDGRRNTALGYASLTANISGSLNTAVGYSALRETTASGNTAIGFGAMENNTTGASNLAAGASSSYFNETGSLNVALGQSALNQNVDGDHNVVIGGYAAGEGTSIFRVTALGYEAGRYSSANDNTFIGYESGQATSGAPLTGTDNTFVGYQTGLVNTSGFANTFVGDHAGAANIDGDENTFIGSSAGDNHTTGVENIFIGSNSGGSHSNYNVAIGEKSGQVLQAGASLNVFVGDDAGYLNTTGDDNTFIGGRAGILTTTGSRNIIIGRGATNLTATTDDYLNIGNAIYGVMDTDGTSAVGDGEATITIDGDLTVTGSITGTSANFPLDADLATSPAGVLIDINAGADNFLSYSGTSNLFLGIGTGDNVTTATQNLLIGEAAGDGFTTASNNVVIGRNAFAATASETGSGSVAIGHSAGNNGNARAQVFIGSDAASSATPVGSDSVVIGYRSMANSSVTSNRIVAIGGSAALNTFSATPGSIFVGSSAGINGTFGTSASLSNAATAIGLNAGGSYETTGFATVLVGSNAGANASGNHNTLIGAGAGQYNKTGDNTMIGYQSGMASSGSPSTGTDNTFVGYQTGLVNTSGGDNTFFGDIAGQSNTTGSENTFVGASAGINNTDGRSNVFIGDGAGETNVSGQFNAYLGHWSGRAATGDRNTLLGSGSGFQTTTGARNIFVGNSAGASNLTGSRNIILGVEIDNPTNATSDYLNISNAIYGVMDTDGSHDVGDGEASITIDGDLTVTGTITGGATSLPIDVEGENEIMEFNTSGNTFMRYLNTDATLALGLDAAGGLTDGDGAQNNIIIGNNAGQDVTTGDNNVFIGLDTGNSFTAASNSVLVGAGAGKWNTGGSYSTAVGWNALAYVGGANNTAVGARALYANSTGANNTALGYYAGEHATANDNTFIGYQSGRATTGAGELTGTDNTFVGYQTGLVNTSGGDNTFIGDSVGSKNTTGANNTAVGSGAGIDLLSGDTNALFGGSAGANVTTGSSNTFLGASSGFSATTASQTVAVGYFAGNSNVSSLGNTFIGGLSGRYATGVGNTMIGYSSGIGASGTTTGQENTFVGRSAGGSTTSGSFNVFLGEGAGADNTTGNVNILIGQDIEKPTSDNTTDWELNIGNVIYGTMGTTNGEYNTLGDASASLTLDGDLIVSNNITYSGYLTDTSDRRLKTDIEALTETGSVIERLSKIEGYKFRMKDDVARNGDDAQIEYGVMAQEIERIFPELVITADDEMGTKSVNYIGLIAPMIESIKELKSQNAALETRMSDIETTVNERLSALENSKSNIEAHSHDTYKVVTAQNISPIHIIIAFISGLFGALLIFGLGFSIANKRQQA